MYKKVITSTHYNRPEYSKQCVEHLENANDINNYLVLFFVEPGNEDVIKIVSENSLNKEIIINDERLGLFKNKLYALGEGFKLSDYVIHVEDDILLAKDALQYFDWANKYKDDDKVFSVTAYHRTPKSIEKNNYFKVSKRNWYTCWGFSMWKDRWEELVNEKWNGNATFLHKNLLGDRLEAYPLLSRSQNIGVKSGHHSRYFSEEWYQKHHVLKHWYENVPNIGFGKFSD